ncbi:MAG: PDDEXK nuclease domain-containing protein [Ignavibacteria bacterium]|nr:PDDEXK nuclease domain-containing protein [Ignavibacteria bacterium]
MVEAYWLIGKRIIEEEQNGKERANYGAFLITGLSQMLIKDFGKGFDESNLRYIRKFYLLFPIRDALRHELTWTHYRLLLKVETDTAREYYIHEVIANMWSTRQLERQINSFYYERILSSRNKRAVRKEVQLQKIQVQPEDIIKDPYVLEFLNLKGNSSFFEKDLEQALIDNLQKFILELGSGFAFVERQKRIPADNDSFYIDLVFYNYILKCFVLLDLKVGKLTHQDIGQMDFYVRYFENEIKQNDDNPTIGIILCSEKNETIVKYSMLNEGKSVFASKYKLFLPGEKDLIEEIERERALFDENKKQIRNL